MVLNPSVFLEKTKEFFFKFDVYFLTLLALAFRVFERGSSSYGVAGELYRDLEVEFNFLRLGQWPLLGPASSLGGFNFGAAYYYFLAPFVWLFRFAPYGATFVSLLLSVLSVWMLYKLLRLWFVDPAIARLGELFLAVCVLDIQNAYYVSNPNLMPFFILWFLYSLTMLLSGRIDWKVYVGLGLSFGIATQLHATALLLLPAIFIGALLICRPKLLYKRLVVSGLLAAVFYIPYAIYELSHNFTNTRGLLHLGQRNFGLLIRPSSVLAIVAFWQSWLVSRAAFFDFLAFHTALSLVLIGLMLAVLFRVWMVRGGIAQEGSVLSRPGKILLLLWIGLGTLMFLFFQYAIQTFYFMVLWPAPLILLAWLTGVLWRCQKTLAVSLAAVFFLAQAVQMCYFYPNLYQPAFDHKNLMQDFSFVKSESQGRSFNVFNNILDVNQFLYYERLSGLNSLVTKTRAEKLFVLCGPSQPALCDLNDQAYHQVSGIYKNGLIIKIYQN